MNAPQTASQLRSVDPAAPPIDWLDAPLHLIVNPRSGHHRGCAAGLPRGLPAELPPGARRWHVYQPRSPAELPALADRVVSQAQTDGGVIVAAGGDGTINTVVQALWEREIPFGVLPQGTFNFFGRQHGLSPDGGQALVQLLDALDTGSMQPVQLGWIGGRIFLVNASLGLYPELLEEREAMKRRHGRSQWVARLAGLASLLRPHRRWWLRLTHTDLDGHRHQEHREATTLFVGNNRLQLRQVGLPDEALRQGGLGALTLAPVDRPGMIGLILQGLAGRLRQAQAVHDFSFSSLDVDVPGRRRVRIAIDGERLTLPLPLRIAVAPKPLWLIGARGQP